MIFKKCVMEKPLGNWSQKHVTWLPENLAVVGQMVKFHLQSFVWSDGWRVLEVCKTEPGDLPPLHDTEPCTQACASSDEGIK